MWRSRLPESDLFRGILRQAVGTRTNVTRTKSVLSSSSRSRIQIIPSTSKHFLFFWTKTTCLSFWIKHMNVAICLQTHWWIAEGRAAVVLHMFVCKTFTKVILAKLNELESESDISPQTYPHYALTIVHCSDLNTSEMTVTICLQTHWCIVGQ